MYVTSFINQVAKLSCIIFHYATSHDKDLSNEERLKDTYKV